MTETQGEGKIFVFADGEKDLDFQICHIIDSLKIVFCRYYSAEYWILQDEFFVVIC